MRRILLFVIINVLCLGAINAEITWTFKNGTLTISGTGDMKNVYGEYQVPWYAYRDDIESVVIEEGVTDIGNMAFMNCKNLTSVKIASTVKNIRSNAFDGCSGLTEFTIPRTIEGIYLGAFYGCTGLKSIFIPNTIQAFGIEVFAGCDNIESIVVEEGSDYLDSRNNCNAIIRKTDNKLVAGCKNSFIPEGVTTIASCAFMDIKSLASIKIPEGVKNIEDLAFTRCSSLTELKFPNSLEKISTDAFSDCTNLRSIDFGTGVKSIYKWAFYGCNNLTSITIPENVSYIGNRAFEECKNLKEATIYVNKNMWMENDIFASSGLKYLIMKGDTLPKNIYSDYYDQRYDITTVVVSPELYSQYSTAYHWSNFKKIAINITDAEQYSFDGQHDNVYIYYSRNFNNDNWQPLYVPFSMSYDDWKDNYEVAALNNFNEYYDGNGKVIRRALEVRPVKQGTLRPNHPYLIRAKEKGEKRELIANSNIAAAEENSISCSSVENKYTFHGTYHPVTGMASKGCLFMNGGTLYVAYKDETVLKPQRWYLSIENLGDQWDGEYIKDESTKSISIHLIDNDEETTGLSVVTSYIDTNKSAGIYDISGRSKSSESKGVNIIRHANGKVSKVIMK